MQKKPDLPKADPVEPDELRSRVTDDDVEGHGLPTTAPPSIGANRLPGHGGEVAPTLDDEDDVEGHRSIR